MEDIISENKDLFDLLIQILVVILPVILTWFVRNYVKSTESQKRLGSIVRLANTAIDFVEDLDNRGELDDYLKRWGLPEDVINLTSSGIKKLNLAGKFAESELGKLGIKMTDQEAQAWIASEFQKRVGDIGRGRSVAERTREAVNLLRTLEQSGFISLPSDVNRATLLADQIATWVLTQLDADRENLLLEDARTRLKSELISKPQPIVDSGELPLEIRLADLAKQSVLYVEQLKLSHELTIPEVDIAVGWVLTEVTKRGLDVTTAQIANAVRAAFA